LPTGGSRKQVRHRVLERLRSVWQLRLGHARAFFDEMIQESGKTVALLAGQWPCGKIALRHEIVSLLRADIQVHLILAEFLLSSQFFLGNFACPCEKYDAFQHRSQRNTTNRAGRNPGAVRWSRTTCNVQSRFKKSRYRYQFRRSSVTRSAASGARPQNQSSPFKPFRRSVVASDLTVVVFNVAEPLRPPDVFPVKWSIRCW